MPARLRWWDLNGGTALHALQLQTYLWFFFRTLIEQLESIGTSHCKDPPRHVNTT